MKKLLKIQNELKVPKSQMNTFGGYKYRSCEDILEAVKPICKENNCLLTLSDEMICIGNRNYVKVTALLTDLEDGTSISVTANAREEETKKGMDGSQITGASSSYARKYALNGLFAIDDTKDSDATNNGKVDDYTFKNGEYAGRNMTDVVKVDREYVEKLANNPKASTQLKQLAKKLLEA